MLETGIIRKIDELGRVVIPKEIRKNLKVNEGDPIEIYVDDAGNIILKKYSVLKGLDNDLYYLAKILYDQYKNTVILTNDEKVITAYGKKAGEYLDASISNALKTILLGNKSTHMKHVEITTHQIEESGCYIIPVVDNNAIIASLIMIEDTNPTSNQDQFSVDLMMRFFSKKLLS